MEEEPPAKKGKISTITQEGAFPKNLITIPEEKRKVVKCKHDVVRRKSTMLNGQSKSPLRKYRLWQQVLYCSLQNAEDER